MFVIALGITLPSCTQTLVIFVKRIIVWDQILMDFVFKRIPVKQTPETCASPQGFQCQSHRRSRTANIFTFIKIFIPKIATRNTHLGRIYHNQCIKRYLGDYGEWLCCVENKLGPRTIELMVAKPVISVRSLSSLLTIMAKKNHGDRVP